MAHYFERMARVVSKTDDPSLMARKYATSAQSFSIDHSGPAFKVLEALKGTDIFYHLCMKQALDYSFAST